ncbi:MAG TPA: NlpC/P60 family protein [Acidimicrobiia bacterium]|nr:NlpC/P60 family protein [Acidimicrobiia bacterium]
MHLRPTRLVPILLAAALATALVPVSGADAAPIDDKRAEAAQLQAQIDANGRKVDALSEENNGARYRLEQATAARDDAQARIDRAKAETTRLKGLLRGRAVSVYKGAGSTSPLDAIDVADAQAFAARSKYASAASTSQNKLVDELNAAEEQLAARKQEFESAIEQARSEQRRIEAARSEIEAANAKQAELLGQVKGELATFVAQEEQRREAEDAARAAALTAPRPVSAAPASQGRTASPPSSGGGGNGGGASWSGPSASGGAAAAIAFARAQIGKPYVYAAAGPDAYDCSGLTMRAWQAGGISMPHYSGAQAAMFPRVPLDALQPGDLIYYGPGGSDHIALYSGGGMVVYAPQTGGFVKERPIYGSPSGAVRPG